MYTSPGCILVLYSGGRKRSHACVYICKFGVYSEFSQNNCISILCFLCVIDSCLKEKAGVNFPQPALVALASSSCNRDCT